jgi:hypothetical protein
MFKLPDGRPLSPDVAFTLGDVSYPANWLRLASSEEREAIGITEAPDPEPYDERFYWQSGLPKDHGQLVEQWTAQTRTTAGTLLAPTDWMVIREADNGTAIDADTKALRQAIRDASGVKVAAIQATTTTDELAAYVTSADYSQWPPYPAPAPEPTPEPTPEPEETLEFSSGVTSA